MAEQQPVHGGLSFIENVPTQRSYTSVFWGQGDFFLNNKKRVATVTDVKFLHDELCIVAHRAAAKLYLVEIANNQFTITDNLVLDTAKYSLNLKKKLKWNRFFHPDLMTLLDDTLYITEYSQRLCSVSVKNNKLKFNGVVDTMASHTHGCFSNNGAVWLGPMQGGHIESYLPDTGESETILTGIAENRRIKTIGKDETLYVLGTDTQRGSTEVQGVNVDTWISLCDISNEEGNVVDSVALPKTQIDGHKYYKGLHFFSLQSGDDDNGSIAVYKVKDNTLVYVDSIPVFAFPHGLDIRNDKLIYSSYSQSAIYLIELQQITFLKALL